MDQVSVTLFPRHRLHRCMDDCEGCFVCEGGLSSCETCGGAEASLPTHCPQVAMDSMQQLLVQQGSADFKDGEWHYINPWYGPLHITRCVLDVDA